MILEDTATTRNVYEQSIFPDLRSILQVSNVYEGNRPSAYGTLIRSAKSGIELIFTLRNTALVQEIWKWIPIAVKAYVQQHHY